MRVICVEIVLGIVEALLVYEGVVEVQPPEFEQRVSEEVRPDHRLSREEHGEPERS